MRLFIGIAIPERVKMKIHEAASELQAIFPGKYVPGDSYHITLAYIGECDDGMRIKAERAMAECALNRSPARIDIGFPGFFGKAEKSILHLTADRAGCLQPVTNDLRSLLEKAALPFDPKPLVPHITLGRKVAVSEEIHGLRFDIGSFYSSGLTLFHSCRINDELKYIPIHFESFKAMREDI